MKNPLIKVILCLFVLALAFVARGQFTFTTNNGAITITGYNTAAGQNAVIPASTNDYPVVNIGNNAFYGSIITNVVIPDSVTNIGANAFEGSELMSVTIGNSVTSIGGAAFQYCNNLTSVTIGNSVTSIAYSTFLFCSSLTNVTIPNSVTNIGPGAFVDCSSLTSVAIPNGVTSISSYAFNGCLSLTSVTIGNSVTSIGGGAFGDCYSLTNLMVDAANPAYSSLNGSLFDKAQTTLIQYAIGQTNQSYTIPNSVTTIGSVAFFYCNNLTSVNIGNSVTNVGGSAFSDCSKLTNIYFLGNSPTPTNDTSVFSSDSAAVAYYLPGTTGWGTTFDGIPARLWNPQASTLEFTGGHFGFSITGPTNTAILLQASTNLMTWNTLGTYTLTNGIATSFTDSNNYPNSFYRFRSP